MWDLTYEKIEELLSLSREFKALDFHFLGSDLRVHFRFEKNFRTLPGKWIVVAEIDPLNGWLVERIDAPGAVVFVTEQLAGYVNKAPFSEGRWGCVELGDRNLWHGLVRHGVKDPLPDQTEPPYFVGSREAWNKP